MSQALYCLKPLNTLLSIFEPHEGIENYGTN